jgi:hypothetical protein
VNTRLLLMSALCFLFGVVVRFDTDDYKRFLAVVKDAWKGIAFKERAFAMQLDKGQLSRIEACLEPLHMHRIVMLGAEFPVFFQNLSVALARDYGLSAEARAAAMLASVIGGRDERSAA